MWAVLSPFHSKREGYGFLFSALKRRKFFLRLSMISWGQFYVTEEICEFLKRHNLLIKLQPWVTFLWTTFCPCLLLQLACNTNSQSYDWLVIIPKHKYVNTNQCWRSSLLFYRLPLKRAGFGSCKPLLYFLLTAQAPYKKEWLPATESHF